jgi:hypothetical protein
MGAVPVAVSRMLDIDSIANRMTKEIHKKSSRFIFILLELAPMVNTYNQGNSRLF